MLKKIVKNHEINKNIDSKGAAQTKDSSKLKERCYSKKVLRSSQNFEQEQKINTNQLPSSPSASYKQKIVCQLPFERLSKIWNFLREKETKFRTVDRVLSDAQFFAKLKNIDSTMQIFCLFCDKKFSTKALLAKHTERVHTIVSQRRSSGRNSQSFINSTCTYCTKNKKAASNAVPHVPVPVQGSSNDLNNLFLHFIDKHPDKYFSCKHCIIRFNDVNLLNDHGIQNHPNKPEEFKFVQPISEDITNQNVQTRRQRRLSIECKPVIEEPTVSPRRSISKTRKYKNDSPCGTPVKLRSKVGRFCPSLNDSELSNSMVAETNYTRSRSEILSCTFDINFYNTIAANVKKNLQLFVDGKLCEGKSTFINPVQTICSTLVRSPVQSTIDGEIHKATSLSIVTAFPTLLTADQYNGCDSLSSKKRSHTKNSWKWKWDSVKKYKYVNEGGKIIKKVKKGNQGLRDLSKLDMWTQLTMRTKFEKQFNMEEKIEEQRRQIDELNLILNQRRLPDISLEQSEQSFIKLERLDFNETDGIDETRRSEIEEVNFPLELNLNRIDKRIIKKSVILSGEWARPRFYVCFGCGEKFEKIRNLEEHKFHKHPYVASAHYEMVGRELMQGNLYKNFFIPLKALKMIRENGLNTKLKTDCTQRHDHDESMDSVHSVIPIEGTASDDSDSKTTALTVHSNVTRSTDELDNINYLVEQQEYRSTGHNSTESTLECTKCNKLCHGSLELYKHILDCSGDYAWILAKRKKYRYIGTSRRRRFNRNSNSVRKKKDVSRENASKADKGDHEEHQFSTQSPKPGKTMNSAQKNKQTDADTIQRMLQNLPAKRVCRQILPQLNQKPKSKKSEDKTGDIPKPLPAEESTPREFVEEQTGNKVVNDNINNGNDAINVDTQKSAKSVKPRKVNSKLSKDNFEDNNVTQISKNECRDDDQKKKLRSSPRNQSNVENVEEHISCLVSPVKRRPKKISDCIAKLQEKLGLPFFGNQAVDIPESVDAPKQAIAEESIKPIDTEENIVRAPKRKSLTRKIVKAESLVPLSKKIDQQSNLPIIKPIQIQAVQPTIQNQSSQHSTQRPIAHVEAIRPTHFSDASLPPRRPSILLPTLVPPPPPPPVILPSTISLSFEQDDAPLDLSRKPAFENGALDLSKASKINSIEVNTNNMTDILKSKTTSDTQTKRRKNRKEIVPVLPLSKVTHHLPIVNELKNKLRNVSITSKCVLNIPQTSNSFELVLDPPKNPISENAQLVIPNFKGCVDIIKIPAPKPPVLHTEKPSVTIKAIPAPPPPKRMVTEKVQEKGFIGVFESFIEKKAADNTGQPSSQLSTPPQENDPQSKSKLKRPPRKSKADETKRNALQNPTKNDENKSPQNKRRSSRFKLDKISAEKEILSDEDVPLSVTKMHLTAENLKELTLQTACLEKDEHAVSDSLAEKHMLENISNHNLIESTKDLDTSNKNILEAQSPETTSFKDNKSKPETTSFKDNKSKPDKPKKKPPKEKTTKKDPIKRSGTKKRITPLESTPTDTIVEPSETNTNISKHAEHMDKSNLVINEPLAETTVSTFQETMDKINAKEIGPLDILNNATVIDSSNNKEVILQNQSEYNLTDDTQILNENIDTTEDKITALERCETVEQSNQTKKKRKRRKNELAAIVADQLLESFKEVDKSRIDDLKMLENLAYEKSEDLLLTGMRLTPTTKRKQQTESIQVPLTSQKKSTGRKKKDKILEVTKPASEFEEAKTKTFGNGKTFESFRSIGESNKVKDGKEEVPTLFKATLPNHRVDIKRKKKATSSSLNLDDEDEEKFLKNTNNFDKKQKKKKRNVNDTKRDLLRITELISQLSQLSICIGKPKSKKGSTSSLKISSISKLIKDRDSKNILLKPSVFNAQISDQQLDNEEKVTSRDPRINKSYRSQRQLRTSQRLSRRSSQCVPSAPVQSVPPAPVIANDEDQEDCFLAEITKKVNDQIMAEDKDFNDTNDGFELVKTMMDGDTRMSACSAPPGPGDENTNTDIMDMDLDDNMSVYSTFSTKSVGSRRRRRKSILLSRKPKKSRNSDDIDDRKFECFLCTKAFCTLSSLKSHNKTLTHVQNLSQQEFLNSQRNLKSKSLSPTLANDTEMPIIKSNVTVVVRETPADSIVSQSQELFKQSNTDHTDAQNQNFESTRLKLNPDEKLFYECCNILKGSETPRVERTYPIANTTYPYDITPPQPVTERKNNVDVVTQFSDISSDSPNIEDRNNVSARIVVNQPYGGQSSNFRLPMHSPSSQGSVVAAPIFQSTNCRLKTKAAMKGYDNLKVSIPTYGLDLQQALERSPQGGCKLSALADIALGSEVTKAAVPLNNDSDALDVSLIGDEDKPSEYITISGTHKQKDVYDFDDTIDNMSDKVAHIQPKETRTTKIIIPERPFKNIGQDEEQSIKFQKPEVIIPQNEESLLSTLSYSDRDDFNYGSVSDKYDEYDDKQKASPEAARASSLDSSSMSSAVTAKTLENKSLIMGRIFKKAVRDDPPKRKSLEQVKPTENNGKKKDFNKLFDNLRNIGLKHHKKIMKKSAKKKVTKSTKKVVAPTKNPPIEDGQRKSQRRCAANRPKKLVEMWSSDEYEEFLSTNDVIALIEEKEREEKKKQVPAKITARRNTIVIEKADEIKPKPKAGKSNKPSLPSAPKITSRRKTISVVNQPKLSSDPFRKPQTFGSKQQQQASNKKESSATDDKPISILPKISKRRKTITQKSEDIVQNVANLKKKKNEESETKSQQRKKRQSVDRLYYWSSSSEDEDFGRLPSPNQEEEVATEPYQQHGWIVGGSHKKLVKLLAFAKGTKKVDDSGLKPSSNGKRK